MQPLDSSSQPTEVQQDEQHYNNSHIHGRSRRITIND